MKKSLLFLLLLFSFTARAQYNPGDSIWVPTFTFGSPQDAWFVLPPDTLSYEKVLIKYTLKCNPAQNPACGQWDYLTNTYLYHHTGLLDSSRVVQPTLVVNGTSPDSVYYSLTPTYSYDTTWQYFITHNSVVSFDSAIVGTGTQSLASPFGASNAVSRSQFLWKASELSAAGLNAGNITGMRFYVQTPGSSLRNLRIRITHSTLDSLTQATLTNTGFTDVYLQNTGFGSVSGWYPVQFTTPFNWDGTSNLLIEITYDNTTTGTDNVLAADSTSAYKSGIWNAGNDRTVEAVSGGHISIPLNNDVAAIDSFITVSFWAYGDANAQPQDGTSFEAIDSLNQRVINGHVPWSDNNVYWDAGNSGSGSYDRINKQATTPETEGQWNYWSFVKNAATGSMKIYLNGNIWHTGTAKTRTMSGINSFRLLKGNWGGSNSYAGRLDEFTVFNKELSAAEIQNYMMSPITSSDTNYSSLVLHYNFNDGNYSTLADAAPGAHAPALISSARNDLKSASEIQYGFTESFVRPNVVFEQGVYTSVLDSMQVVDSIVNTSMQIVLYNDSSSSSMYGVATDTLYGWPVSSASAADSIIYLSHYDYYNKFPQVIRYELGRYITPYGNGLSLGNGWTWTFDVSDYVTLLHDSVHLAAGNWQELLDMKFLFIVGTPPRPVLGFQNVYSGNFDYGIPSDPIDNHLTAKNIFFPNNAVNSRWKARITGHGMDSPGNCAEFCPKNHFFLVDAVQRYQKLVWRDNCDRNPLYPQGGTWVYDRANWCPGAEVWTYDFELTPYVSPGSTHSLDHNVQAYNHTSGWDYYQIEEQVVFYGAPNFTLDASLDEIKSPSTDQMWLRYNPSCTAPVVRITNTGTTTLTSLTFTYGFANGPMSTYTWTGSLPFMESTDVTLGTFGWAQGASQFVCSISAPNGGTDQYAPNNTRRSSYVYPPVMPTTFVIELKTNNYPFENDYTLKNSAGVTVHSRSGLNSNTTYKDTITLPNDCYTFEMLDSGEDGLSWWANTSQGNGTLRFRSATSTQIFKNFNSDFGGQVYQQFTVGFTSGVNDYMLADEIMLRVYPNPGNGMVTIDFNLTQRDNAVIDIFDVLGSKVYSQSFENIAAETTEANLSSLGTGVYFVRLRTADREVTQKLIIN